MDSHKPDVLLPDLAPSDSTDSNIEDSALPDATAPKGFEVHFKKPGNWSSAHVHYWSSEPDRLQSTWPGVAMTAEGNGWYVFSLPTQQSASLVFNDNGKAQTVDLAKYKQGWFTPTGFDHQGHVVGRWTQQNPDTHPEVSADPPGESFYAKAITIALRATGPNLSTVRYTVDGSDPATGGTAFKDKDTLKLTNTTTLRLFAQNTNGTHSAKYLFTKKAEIAKEKWDSTDKPTSVVKLSSRFEKLVAFNNDQGLKSRDVVVFLPGDYHTSTKTYRVIYFHDGQNLFDPKTSTFGVEWQVDEHLDELVAEGLIHPAIVVGIYNAGADRTKEYAGSSSAGDAKAAYTDWVIHSLKPYIDEHYRTKHQAEFTAVAGSSFGGIISIYQSWNHPDVFSQAGCVSNAFVYNGAQVLSAIENYTGAKKPVRYWIDSGSEEGNKEATGESWYVAQNRKFAERLAQLGWEENEDLAFFEDIGAAHNEAAWAKRIKKILYFLLRKEAPTAIRTNTRTTLPGLNVNQEAFGVVDVYFEHDFWLTKLHQDQTPAWSITSSLPSVVSVDPKDGRLKGKAVGSADIVGKFLGFSDKVKILVK